MTETRDNFQLRWHGNTVVITPSSSIEHLRWDLIEQAAGVVMEPLKSVQAPMVVFDLSEVGFFGSVFLSLLMKCHKFVKHRGGELVLCGASPLALDLFKVTALDTLWAIYDTKEEALEALAA